MTPAGHISIAYLSSSVFKKLPVSALIIGALIPDIDFIFVFFPWFDSFHRSATHSLLFITLTSGLFSMMPKIEDRKIFYCGVFLGSLLHILADSMMDANPGNGLGVQIFWPFLDYYFMPFNIMGSFGKGPGWSRPLEQLKYSLPALLIETPLLIASIILYISRKKKSSH